MTEINGNGELQKAAQKDKEQLLNAVRKDSEDFKTHVTDPKIMKQKDGKVF